MKTPLNKYQGRALCVAHIAELERTRPETILYFIEETHQLKARNLSLTGRRNYRVDWEDYIAWKNETIVLPKKKQVKSTIITGGEIARQVCLEMGGKQWR